MPERRSSPAQPQAQGALHAKIPRETMHFFRKLMMDGDAEIYWFLSIQPNLQATAFYLYVHILELRTTRRFR